MFSDYIEPGVPVPLFWAFVGAAILVQGISKSGFAGGAGILSLPLMMLVMRADLVAATMLPLLVLCDFNAIYHYRRDKDWSQILRIYIPSLAGIVVGAMIWRRIGETGIERYERWIERFVGVVAIVFAAYVFAKDRAMRWVERFRPGLAVAVPVGVLAGLISTLIHAAGPLVSLYAFTQGMGKTLFVGTVAWTFTLVNVTKLPFYWHAGMLPLEVLAFDLRLVWLIPIGSYLGRWMHDRVNERAFDRVVLGLAIVAGIQLLSGVNLIHWLVEPIAK